MDPITIMAGASLATTAIGAGVSAYGAYQGGQAQKQMYDYKAAVAQVNQQIAKQNADYALHAGEVEAQQAGMKLRSEIGQIRAGQGASGLDIASGSAPLVRDSATRVGQENIAIIRSNAAKRAYGYEVEAMEHGAESTLDTVAGANAKTAGTISAIGSLLGGASSVSSKWVGYKTSGALG